MVKSKAFRYERNGSIFLIFGGFGVSESNLAVAKFATKKWTILSDINGLEKRCNLPI